jgi:hypothetical protein
MRLALMFPVYSPGYYPKVNINVITPTIYLLKHIVYKRIAWWQSVILLTINDVH